MNDYEQMSSSDSTINDSSHPFTKNKKSKGFSEIIQNKNSLRKYIIAIIICVFFIYFIVLTINKSSQVRTLNQEISLLETEMKGIEEGKEDLSKKVETLKKRNAEIKSQYDELSKEAKEIQKKIDQVKQTNDVSNEGIKNYQQQLEPLQKELKEEEDKESQLDQTINELKEQQKKQSEMIIQLNKSIKDLEDLIAKSNLLSNLESKILQSNYQIELLTSWINIKSISSMKLLYQASRDGYSPDIFHKMVNTHKNTITLLLDKRGSIFGGFTTRSWDGFGFKEDKAAILFNLSNKFISKVFDYEKAIYADPSYLSVFGASDLVCNSDGASSKFPLSYQGKNKYELTDGEMFPSLVEMEVIKVTFQ